MSKAGIISCGSYVPEKILTNSDLEQMVDTSDEWILTRTGIKERRIASSEESVSDMALKACKKCLAAAKVSADKIDLLIVATITPDMQFPSTACFVQKELGILNAACFDISAACAGFVYAMVIAEQFVKTGTYKNVLIVGAEKLSSITDWSDRNTCVLFGDGAGAALISTVKRGGIRSSMLASDGGFSDLLFIPAGGSRQPATQKTVEERLHFIKMRGNELFKHAVSFMADAASKALKKAGLGCEDVTYIIPHQANIRILDAVARKLKIPKEKIYLNIHKYGNMSSASTAVALSDVVNSKEIKKGDILVLDAFGGGLVWGAVVVEW